MKEIISQEGMLHFQRWRLWSSKNHNLYLHRISQSDLDAHMHSHPWHFKSRILKGSYFERTLKHLNTHVHGMSFFPGDVVEHDARNFHQLTLHTPVVWTLVWTSGRERDWGYLVNDEWMDHRTYRQLKRAGKLPAQKDDGRI